MIYRKSAPLGSSGRRFSLLKCRIHKPAPIRHPKHRHRCRLCSYSRGGATQAPRVEKDTAAIYGQDAAQGFLAAHGAKMAAMDARIRRAGNIEGAGRLISGDDAPTLAEFNGALPKDPEGRPDVIHSASRVMKKITGKLGANWSDLTPEQRVEAVELAKGEAWIDPKAKAPKPPKPQPEPAPETQPTGQSDEAGPRVIQRGRNEKYDLDVTMEQTADGYTIRNSNPKSRDEVISSGSGGVYHNDDILNLRGRFVAPQNIVQGRNDQPPANTPYKGTPEQMAEAKRLAAEIQFAATTGDFETMERLEGDLRDFVAGRRPGGPANAPKSATEARPEPASPPAPESHRSGT